MPKGLILVIEDDDDNMELIKFLLNKAEYEVLTASDGHTGLKLVTSEKPDLVLLDLAIPGIDGWNLAKRIRSIPDIAETPLVAVSAHILPRDRQEAIEAGCNGFLTKPLDVANFVTSMESYLHK
ncbi:MAG: response regulator [Anaerolineaceae bacterium]|jgi:two-component system cell cycle response regulator DivK|nr:response regulator [Anaerolineaceae bacterium]